MQQRQLIWLGGSLLVLLGLAFFTGTFDNEISTVDVPALSISSDAIESIEIVTSDSSVFQLTRNQNQWMITAPIEAAVDSVTVNQFADNLGDARIESVVSTNPDKYDTFGVGPSAKHTHITWGRNRRTFYVGNTGPDFQSFYLRMGGDTRVFLARGRLNVPEDLDTWRDKTLINIPSLAVNEVSVTTPAFSYNASKTGTSWTLIEDEDRAAADSLKTSQWLARFAPLRATGFMSDVSAAQVKSDATHQIHFSVPGGSTQTVWILEQDDQLAATVSGSDAIYRLTKSLLSSYFPAPEDLQPEDE